MIENPEEIQIDEKFLNRWVSIFVDKYIKEGKVAAGLYADEFIPREIQLKLQERVRKEFRARGYVFASDTTPSPSAWHSL